MGITLPIAAVNTSNVDAGTDNPSLARADILDLINKVNSVLANLSTAAGAGVIAVRNGSGQVVGDITGNAATASQLGGQTAVQLAPPGAVMPFAGAVTPTGWLLCDGTAVSRTTYAALFAAISTTYGSGDGSTTFNLPELRGEFIRGLDNGRGIDSGRTVGSAQLGAVQSHSHTVSTNGTSVPISPTGSTISILTAASGNTGSTGGTETRPRNVAMAYIIKT